MLLEKFSSKIARQHNDFILAPQELNINEFKLFLLAISKIKTTDKEYPEITISVDEYKKAIKTDMNLDFNYVHKIAQGLLKAKININTKTHTYDGNFVISVLGSKEDLTFKFNFAEEMKPFLLQLSHYTQSNNDLMMSFGSYYSARIYQILKMHFGREKKGEYEFVAVSMTVEDIKSTLKLPEETYNNFGQLKRNVLEKAKNDINNNNYSDIQFSYEELKRQGSRKVIGITFNIYPKFVVPKLGESKTLFDEPIRKIKEKIQRIKENLVEDDKKRFIEFLKSVYKAGWKTFLQKPADEFTLDDLKKSKMLDYFILTAHLTQEEQDVYKEAYFTEKE